MKEYTLNDTINQMMVHNIPDMSNQKITYNSFKQAARKLQIWWRKNILDVDYYKYENILRLEDARKGLIFFEGFRVDILNYLKQPLQETSSAPSGQMLTNLLRSEHIPYNIFFPMQYDEEGCRMIFNDIIGKNEIKNICNIQIEYHPSYKKRAICDYLNDHTAFDVYIEYMNQNDDKCGIGIEVKYTEKEYPLKKGSREYNHVKDASGHTCLSKEYAKATKESGWFKDGVEDILVSNKFRQIWRNHILGASMVLKGDVKNFYSVTLFPLLNVHFSKDAMPKYKGTMGHEGLLSEKGFATCIPLTYEHLFDLMDKYIRIGNKTEWIKYLKDRYLLTILDCLEK